jgi:hypothetical protein
MLKPACIRHACRHFRVVGLLLLTTLSTPLAASSQQQVQAALRNNQTRISTLTRHVTQTNDDSERSSCQQWRLTPSDVRKFFARAEAIGGEHWHYGYDQFACSYSGKIEVDGTSYTFEINAGASAIVSGGGEQWYFGCTTCKELVPFEYNYGHAAED